MAVKAKFKCESVFNFEHGKQVRLVAVMGDTPENKSFNDYTPSGTLDFHIAAGKPAGNYFTPGKEYYLTITSENEVF